MALLIKLVFKATGPRTLKKFGEACRSPLETQMRLLDHIIGKNKSSAFGRDHRFDSIRSVEDFRERVPICSYRDLWPYIERAMNGEGGQLTLEKPELFASTSGTTGSPKYIPVTQESSNVKSQLMRVWLSALYRDYPKMFDNRILTIVSPEMDSYAPCGTPCGAESGHGYKNMPKPLKAVYSCPYEVYEIEDYAGKYYALLRIAAGQSLSIIFSVNPSTILLMAQRLGRHTEEIVRDVRDGTLSSTFDIEAELRSAIAAEISPDPGRAAELEKAADDGDGVLLPKHVWPDMEVICCWKGGTVGLYIDKFDRYFRKGLPVRDIGFLATEVRGSVPLSDKGSDGVLSVPTNVFEFFPADEDRKPGGTDLLTLDRLEEGRQYFIYVTTHAGLYRYDMNDIVEVTGYYENAPLIAFTQKGKGVVSFTGEKLYEAQVLGAIEKAFASKQGQYEFIAAVGEMHGDIPRYAFLVEFDKSPGEDEGKSLLGKLDAALREQNMEYATKRDSHRLDQPVLRVIKSGEFERYRKREVDHGKKDGQFKTLRLTTDLSFAGEFAVEREVFAGTE